MLRSLLVLCAIAPFIACGSKSEEKAESAEPAAEQATAAPPAVTSIGVPECDDYIAKMRACLPKLPEGTRAAAADSFESAVAGWGDLDDDARSHLPAACSGAALAARTAYEQHGCQF